MKTVSISRDNVVALKRGRFHPRPGQTLRLNMNIGICPLSDGPDTFKRIVSKYYIQMHVVANELSAIM